MLMDNRNKKELIGEDFITSYIKSLPRSEVPTTFHRWCAIVGLGAWIGRDAWFEHMDFKLYPNIYAMLLGNSGVRKSTAIKQFNKILRLAGYTNFTAQKTSKEQFLIDLSEIGVQNEGNITDSIFGDSSSLDDSRVCNMFAAPDEFNELFANNIFEFVSMLGTLWDYDGVFENKVKNSKSVRIPNPCISLIGGNTPATLHSTFPTEVIGQGFFSRILFIHSEGKGEKIAFPSGMGDVVKANHVENLTKIRSIIRGGLTATTEALELLETIYHEWPGIDDVRFASYATRRFTHLLKLVVIHTLADYKTVIEPVHVIRTNTILSAAERMMPTALGEFGKAYNSDVIHKLMTVLFAANEPLEFGALWNQVHGDLNKMSDLQEIISGLLMANRIQITNGGFAPIRKIHKEMDSKLLDHSYMSFEERMGHVA